MGKFIFGKLMFLFSLVNIASFITARPTTEKSTLHTKKTQVLLLHQFLQLKAQQRKQLILQIQILQLQII